MSGGWVLILIIAYAALLTIPFAPGIELGLVLLIGLGPAGAPLVWSATVVGLAAAYAFGRHLPARLRDRVPALPPRLASGRYVLLVVALNVPGNVVLGGGGGLAMGAGASGTFHPLPTLAAMAIAVAPVPLAFWMTGELLL